MWSTQRRKKGHDSKSDDDHNELTLTYQNNLKDSYLYNLKIGGATDRSSSDLRQDVSANGNSLSARNILSLNYRNWFVRNYFEKQLGDKGSKGTFIANLRYTHFRTRYRSSYSEYLPDETSTPVEDHFNRYRINYNALFGEIQYNLPQRYWGTLEFALFGNTRNNRYADVGTDFTQKSTLLGVQGSYYGWIRNIYAYLTLGGAHMHQSNKKLGLNHSDLMPRTNMSLSYWPTDDLKLSARYGYSYNTTSPSQLSETNQWLDNHLTFHGNPNLKPYGEHSLKISASYSHRYINALLDLGYTTAPERICSQYYLTDEFILETLENLKKYRNPYAMLSATLFPLGSKKWSFYKRIIYGRIIGEGAGYSWNESRFQWNSSMSLYIGAWTLSASYQYPGRIAEGQLVRPRGEYWQAGALYRVNDSLFIGADIRMPFGKALRKSEYSVGTDLIDQTTESVVGDWANCVNIKLTWNISFGKNQNRKRPQYDNYDSETGVLKK